MDILLENALIKLRDQTAFYVAKILMILLVAMRNHALNAIRLGIWQANVQKGMSQGVIVVI